MQAIIEDVDENEKINIFTEIGGISILERYLHQLTVNNVIKIFVVTQNIEAAYRIIRKKEFQADFEIISTFTEALQKSFMNSFVIRDCAVCEPSFFAIVKSDNVQKYGNIEMHYIPYKILKNISSITELKHLKTEKINSDKFHIKIRGKKEIKIAEKKLVKMLVLPDEDFVARTFNIPISQFITRKIMHLPITPNIITFFVFILGISAIIPLFMPIGYWKEAMAGFLFHLSSVIDGCDGEIARLKFQTSKKGAILDQLVDESTNIIFITAMNYYAYINFYSSNSLVYILVFAIPVFLILAKIMELFINKTSGYSESLKSKKFNFETEKQNKGADLFFEIIRQLGRNSFIALFICIAGVFSLYRVAPLITFIILGGFFLSFFVQFVIQLKELNKIKKSYKNIKACLFEFDGALVNNMQDFADLAGESISKFYNVSFKHARKRFVDITGLSFIQKMDAIFPGAEKNQEVNEYFENNKRGVFYQKHFDPEVKETLNWLKMRKIKIGVSYIGFRGMMEEFCNKEQVDFDLIMGCEKGYQHFDFMRRKFNLSKDEMLFCGATFEDAKKALDYGIPFIARSTTFSAKAFRSLFRCVKIIHKFSELKRIVY